MRLTSVLLLLALTAPAAVSADGETAVRPKLDQRRHFLVRHGTDVLYEATEISRTSDQAIETIVLARDVGYGDFILRDNWTFKKKHTIIRISDVKDKVYAQASYTKSTTGETFAEVLAELRANPGLRFAPSVVSLETTGGRWDGLHTDLDEYLRLRSLRREIRQTIDSYLLEAMERMRGTLFDTLVGLAFRDFVAQFVVYDVSDDAAEATVAIKDVAADCTFDAAFGFPCSEKQKERVKKAADAGKPLTRY